MDLKDLKCFIAVYEALGVNQAAKRLFITPQGLSKIIAAFEGKLGATLFRRSAKGMIPTESAHFLYERTRELLRNMQIAKNGVRQIAGKEKGLRIACANGVLNALSFSLIGDFIRMNPGLDIEWTECSNDEARSRVTAFSADAALTAGLNADETLAHTRLTSRDIILLLYEGHPLHSRNEIAISELRHEKIVTLNSAFQVNREFVAECARHGFTPDIAGESADSHFVLKLCKLKAGIGVLIDFSVDDFDLGGLRVVPLREKLAWDIYFVCNSRSPDLPHAQQLLKHLQQSCKI